MTEQPLNLAGQVKLNGAGNGTVSLGPNVGQRWTISVASILIPNPTLFPRCELYMGALATPEFFVDGTYTGNLNASDAVAGMKLSNGQKIFAVWTGGDPGATATLSIIGIQETGTN